MNNICYFIGSFSIGGAENLVLQTIKNIDKNKYKIYISAFTNNGQLYNEYKKYANEIYIFPKKIYIFLSIIKFAKFLKKKILSVYMFI